MNRFKATWAGWLLAAVSTLVLAETPQLPKEGAWRGEFTVDGDKIPFNFEFNGKEGEGARLTLVNGSRRDHFIVHRDAKDTYSVPMNTYDADLHFTVEENGKRLVGTYRDLVPNRKGARDLPFVAEYGQNWRFVPPAKNVKPTVNLSGKWAIQQADKSVAVGGRPVATAQEIANRRGQVALLKQEGNRLTGVIMTSVGDTRELEGTVQGNQFYLSHFSGPSPRLIRGTVDEDGNLQGVNGSGIYNVVKFEGHKDDSAELPDPYKLTFLQDGKRSIDFTFPDLAGKPVSLSDDKYKGKVVIVEIIGTWCPNCTDQTFFLAPWFKENQHRGVEAVAVAFEPLGWKATSATYTRGVSPTWHLGTLTNDDEYVGVEEARTSIKSLVEEHVDADAKRGKEVTIGNEKWQSWTDAGGDYAVARVVRGPKGAQESVLVVGSAPADQVRGFAGSLTGG